MSWERDLPIARAKVRENGRAKKVATAPFRRDGNARLRRNAPPPQPPVEFKP